VIRAALAAARAGTYTFDMENRARMLALAALCVAALAASGCANIARTVETTPSVGAAPPAPSSPAGVVHVVQAGQTLYSIARAYGQDVQDLASTNRLADPDRLEVGQRLFIPGAQAVLSVPVSPRREVDSETWQWPVEGGTVLSHFGAPRGRRRHAGLDIRGRHGQPVVAVDDGKVVYSGESMRGYGKTVIIDHGRGLKSLYAHNSSLLVKEGDRVRRGQPIARVGRTGNASGDHCHLEIRQDDVPRDPLRFIAQSTGDLH